MSSDFAIQLRGISKVFAIFSRPEDRLKQMLFRGRRKYFKEFWALRDIDINIGKGETVGIIGRNGSGKSTLLQIICGILTPTTGEVKVSGRIAALLELGAGFNPEYSGRENVFMYGSLIGLSEKEISDRFDSIAAFADIGAFIDQPVKTYSSGMYSRLAFAVAINVDPQILVVDEALSVGDEAFQRKCFARIHQMKEKGATILFVSHSAGAIVELCGRAILLDHGRRLLSGQPKQVVGMYQKLIYAGPENEAEVLAQIAEMERLGTAASAPVAADDLGEGLIVPAVEDYDIESRYDPGMVPQSTVRYLPAGGTIIDPHFIGENGQRLNVLAHNQVYTYVFRVKFEKDAYRVLFAMMIKSMSGVELGSTGSHPVRQGFEHIPAGTEVEIQFRFHNLLYPGTYFTNCGVYGFVDGEECFIHRILDAVMFRVDHPANSRHHAGYVNLFPEPACEVFQVRGASSSVNA